jgi:hypothetical protein
MDALGAYYLIHDGVDTDEYVKAQYYNHGALGATAGGAAKAVAKAGTIVTVVLLAISCYSAYLCFTSEGLIDVALNRMAPGSAAGTFVNLWKAMTAFFSGFSYLIYYAIFKKSRMEALSHLATK